MIRMLAVLAVGMLSACATTSPSIPPVSNVDLPRYMGDWYVIAHIPSFWERDAYDALESYRLDEDGRIRTTFSFRKGGFDAPLETMEPVGTVVPGIVGRSKRDYVWLMARTPQLPKAELDAAVARIGALGYDTSRLRMVPQSGAR